MSKRLRVNPIDCAGHGVCAELLPELITLDEWGYPLLPAGPVPAGSNGRPGGRSPTARPWPWPWPMRPENTPAALRANSEEGHTSCRGTPATLDGW